jgi:luciferase family oxidoreductase group 1
MNGLMIPLSVLDLATVATGSNPAQALAETTQTAVVAERLGYQRLWVAEHHGMPAVASSAPAVLIAHVASATSRIRVGAGGVMLPNHSPLVIAEQYATLEALHPGRIDLGLGRAPGTDHVTARALRRSLDLGADHFPDDVVELINYLLPLEGPLSHPAANPGSGYLPEIWLLGSSTFSAQLAGLLGLPFSFAYHFAPKLVDEALEMYRSNFRASILLAEPHAMVAVSVICAPTSQEATWLSTSSAMSIVQMRTGRRGPLMSPEEASAITLTPDEVELARDAMSTHIIGDVDMVAEGLRALQERTGADELILSTRVHSVEARRTSMSLIAKRWGLNHLSM